MTAPEWLTGLGSFFLHNWAEIVKAALGVWMAIVATLALTTWRRQSSAQRKADLMDELTESVHKFIGLMADPILMVRIVKVGIESYAYYHQLDHSLPNPEAVVYIQNDGREHAKQLSECLNPCMESVSRIASLVVKGQVFGFKNYHECQNACAMLISQYKRIGALRSIIGRTSSNWKNSKVQEVLSKAIALDADEIQKQIEEQHTKFLAFVKENYEAIFN